jgi:hypothetical protein
MTRTQPDVEATPASGSRALPPAWLREWHEPGRTWFRVGRDGRWLVAEWEGLGAVRATPAANGWDVDVRPCAGLEARLEEKWRRGPVRAIVRHLAGHATLHASAVVLFGVTLAFVGDSGAGKSTCAAHLCRRFGAALVADDTLELERRGTVYSAAATELSHWLTPDAAAAIGFGFVAARKEPCQASRVAAASSDLSALFVLRFSDDDLTETVPLTGRAAFEALSGSYVRFILDDPAVALRDLDALAEIVANVPIFSLSRPRRLEALDRQARVVADVASAVVVAKRSRV